MNNFYIGYVNYYILEINVANNANFKLKSHFPYFFIQNLSKIITLILQ